MTPNKKSPEECNKNEENIIAITVTQKEAVAIYYNGHVFNRCDTRENKNGSTRWRCQMYRNKNQKCPVKLKLSSENKVLLVKNAHNHKAPETSKVVFNEVKCKAKKRSRKEPDASVRKILTEEINNVYIDRKVEMNSSTSLNVPVSCSFVKY